MAPPGHALSDMSSADFLNGARVPDNAIVNPAGAAGQNALTDNSDEASDQDQ